MGGRGASSSSAQSSAVAALDRQIESMSDGGSVLERNALRTARAARAMVGTDKPGALAASDDLRELEYDLAAAYGGSVSMRTLSNIEALEAEGLDNRPLGMPADMWPRIKARAQSELSALHEQRFSNEEIAGYINYRNSGVFNQGSASRKSPKTVTLDEFLAQRGLASPISDYTLDTTRLPHGETQRQRNRRINETQRRAKDYAERRRAAIDEYEHQVSDGTIRKPTKIEEMQRVARGNPDNASVQAARRLLKKRGLGW